MGGGACLNDWMIGVRVATLAMYAAPRRIDQSDHEAGLPTPKSSRLRWHSPLGRSMPLIPLSIHHANRKQLLLTFRSRRAFGELQPNDATLACLGINQSMTPTTTLCIPAGRRGDGPIMAAAAGLLEGEREGAAQQTPSPSTTERGQQQDQGAAAAASAVMRAPFLKRKELAFEPNHASTAMVGWLM